MSNTFECQLVTPEAKLLDEALVYASVPAWDGLFGVLPGRAPLLARLGLGELTVRFPDSTAAGGERSFLVDGGFVKMADNKLTILAEKAIPAETLTETDAKAELAEAQARQVPSDAADASAAGERIAHQRRVAELKLRMAQKSRTSGI